MDKKQPIIVLITTKYLSVCPKCKKRVSTSTTAWDFIENEPGRKVYHYDCRYDDLVYPDSKELERSSWHAEVPA